MKNSLLVLGLSTLASLGFAQDNANQSNSNMQRQQNGMQHQQNGDCCACVCCNSCAKEINCECYTPKYYDLKCDCGLFLSVDFLYWYGRENNNAYAVKTKSIATDDTGAVLYNAVQSFEYSKAAWDPGVRVALGFNSDCDGWDYVVAWTWYKNSKKSSSSVAEFATPLPAVDEFGLVSPWSHSIAGGQALMFEKVSSNWEFTFNQLDFEIGRRYWLSRCFTMRPYAGIRGAWTDTDFSITATNPSSIEGGLSVPVGLGYALKDVFDNDFSGGGLLVGFQPNWYWTPCFSLFANMDISLLWGEFKRKKKEVYVISNVDSAGDITSTEAELTNTSSSKYSNMLPMMDLAIGLRYENTYCDCQYRFSLDLGWEHHVLFDLNGRYKYGSIVGEQQVNQTVVGYYHETYNETSHDVSFGGFVLRARFDF